MYDRATCRVNPGRVVPVKRKSGSCVHVQRKAARGRTDMIARVPGYDSVKHEKLQARLERARKRSEIPVICEEQLVVEYYAAR